MYVYPRIILTLAAICIALGGLYDAFTPRLPSNLTAKCSGNVAASVAMRELLRALGGCLVAIGVAVAMVATSVDFGHDRREIALILTLVLPSEGLNAFGMRRVGSPYVIPVFFILLTLAGAALALIAHSSASQQ